MTEGSDRFNANARRVFLARARDIKSTGDMVGPNNYELSNQLWAVAAELRAWAKEKFK